MKRATQPKSRARGRAPLWLAAVFAMCVAALAGGGLAAQAASDASFSTSDGLEYTVTEAPSADNGYVGMATLSDDGSYTGTSLVVPATVTATVDGESCTYDVTAVGESAFKGNTKLKSVTFEGDLTGPYYSESTYAGGGNAIGTSAFQNCLALVEVNFPSKVAGIGTYAFSGCTKLASLNFPDDAELYTNSHVDSAAIGAYAFRNCTALESVSIPPITSTVRKGDAYYSSSDYNPDTNYTASISSFYSGYASYWHDSNGPMARAGIGTDAFAGCTALETVVFEAGAEQGMFAYWTANGAGLDTTGCPSLQAVVYEGTQAYWGNPSQSMRNGTFYDVWLDSNDEEASADDEPTLYYAVDYYATQAEAEAADASGSTRLARVEYAYGTPVAAIATSDEDALEGCTYADASVYALTDADGTIPSAKDAAVAAGLDTANSSTEWVWKLTGGQARREGLTDSCTAYPVQADELSAGRISTGTLADIQLRCDQNLSQWLVDGVAQDSTFDVERWYNGPTYDFTTEATDAYDTATDLWITISSAGEADLLAELEVVAADGTVLDASSCTFTYQRYDADAGQLVSCASFDVAFAALGSSGGPLLVTVEADGYEGSLQEWVLVVGNAGSVMERFTESAAGSGGSWYTASAASEANKVSAAAYSGEFAVRVGGADLASALVGVGYAGLVGGPINVDDDESESYGFALCASYNSKTGIISSGSEERAFASSGDAAAFAVQAYEAFESTSNSGIREAWDLQDLAWGETAVLVQQDALEDVAAAAAAYAYAHQAHVFYLEEDGTVGQETFACLADFGAVTLFGTAATCDEELLATLADALPEASIDASLVCSGTCNAATLSRTVAELLMDEGLASPAVVTISDGEDAFDALGALNRSGLEGGLTLVASGSAEAKQVSTYLRQLRDEVATVRLFGRSDGNALDTGFDLTASLEYLWDEYGNYEEPAVEVGDTVELFGLRFILQSGAGSEADPYVLNLSKRLWGTAALDAGTYELAGCHYLLESDVTSDMGYVEEEDDDAGGEEDAGTSADADAAGSTASGGASGSGSSSGGSGSSGSSSGSGSSGSGSSSSSVSSTSSSSSGSSSSSTAGSTLSLVPTGSAAAAVSSAKKKGSGYVDAGWAVTNVGDVSAILASLSDEDEAASSSSTGSASYASSGSSASVPYFVLVVAALSLAFLALGLWLLLRRRDGEHFHGYDLM